MSEIKMEIAKLEDCERLSELVNSAYRGESSKKGWTTEEHLLGGQRTDPETLANVIREPGSVILMALRDSVLIGCVYLQKKNDSAYLGMLTVQPALQAGGWGRLILTAAEKWVSENWQLPRVEMTVIQKRTELLAWYERRGYTITDRREPFPYGDEKFGLPKVPDLEFLVLEKDL